MGQSSSSSSNSLPRLEAPPRPRLPKSLEQVSDAEYWRQTKQQSKLYIKYRATAAKQRVMVYAECGRRSWQTGRIVYAWRNIYEDWRGRLEPMKQLPVITIAEIAGVATLTGAVAFGASRFGTSFLLQSLRISSSNRLLATLGGGAGLFVCTNVAAHSCLYSSAFMANQLGVPACQWPLQPLSYSSPSFISMSVLFGLFGYLQYRGLGGRLRNLAPSDVMRRGSFAVKHIQAPSNDYADLATKKLLGKHGGQYGCHSCGRSHSWWGMGPRLNFIGDHIPPNKYAKLADIASGAVETPGMPRGVWSRLSPFKPKKTKQIFLPQCERCSLIQSNAVRMDRRTLIFPRSWRPYDFWLPLPLLLAMMFLPFLQMLDALMEDERPAVERKFGFTLGAPIGFFQGKKDERR